MSGAWIDGERRKRIRRGTQLTFADRPCQNGKLRKRPGPKPAARSKVKHYARPRHSKWNPLHITMRAVRGLPTFRQLAIYAAFEESVRLTQREDFRIIEFSIQADHVHLVVEAESNDGLARGMKSFAVRTNRRVNKALGRAGGKLWADRYHREDLSTPRQVRNALVYCLGNFKKHSSHIERTARLIDHCSSARWFTGWNAARSSAEPTARPTPLARVPLLAHLWHVRHGLIDPSESPRRAG